MVDFEQYSGENFRDKLLEIQTQIKEYGLGYLVYFLSVFVTYQSRCEDNLCMRESPDYQCNRELLGNLIKKLIEEINEREEILGG